jgi:hypothetical protein
METLPNAHNVHASEIMHVKKLEEHVGNCLRVTRVGIGGSEVGNCSSRHGNPNSCVATDVKDAV